MRLYNSKQMEAKNEEQKEPNAYEKFKGAEMIPSAKGTAADDFYIYIYDEEEFQKQQKFKSKGWGRTNDVVNRKIGFWCFNAAIGIKQIAALKPRSIILTSGTLSPMDSFQAELGIPFK